MKTEKKMSEKDPDQDNFYSVIETAKGLLENNDWWVIKDKQSEENKVKHEEESK
jgi:hypothetical protein